MLTLRLLFARRYDGAYSSAAALVETSSQAFDCFIADSTLRQNLAKADKDLGSSEPAIVPAHRAVDFFLCDGHARAHASDLICIKEADAFTDIAHQSDDD